MLNFKGKIIYVSGGSGFLGKNLVKYFLNTNVKKIIVYSRDEAKHINMRLSIQDKKDKVRYIVGDVRDLPRLKESMKNVNYVIHAAAMKQLPSVEYNPFEAVKTNIIGTMNVIKAAEYNSVEKVIYISSDKANSPVNLYGASKFCGEKLVQHGFVYFNKYKCELISVRYGNVAGSTGSIIPVFRNMIKKGRKTLPLTHEKMSRFWFTVDGAIQLILYALENGKKQDIIIPKLKSFYIKDLIKAMDCDYDIIGVRFGEKLYEQMINEHECYKEFKDHYVLNPKFKQCGLNYICNKNDFLFVEELKNELKNI